MRMKTAYIAIIVGVFVVVGLLVASGVYAYGKNANGQGFNRQQGQGRANMGTGMRGNCPNHEAMETIMETGTYQDLVALRTQTGKNLKPWVQNEEDFQRAKEMHETMQNSPGIAGNCQGGLQRCMQ
jgi:hypothetical protein